MTKLILIYFKNTKFPIKLCVSLWYELVIVVWAGVFCSLMYGARIFAVPRYVEKNKDNLYLGG